MSDDSEREEDRERARDIDADQRMDERRIEELDRDCVLPRSGVRLKRTAACFNWETRLGPLFVGITSCAEGYRLSDREPWGVRIWTPSYHQHRIPVAKFFATRRAALDYLDEQLHLLMEALRQ